MPTYINAERVQVSRTDESASTTYERVQLTHTSRRERIRSDSSTQHLHAIRAIPLGPIGSTGEETS